MLTLQQLKTFYTPKEASFDRSILREYLQYHILEIIFNSPFGKNLCFLGGTCLRIIYGGNRFSEDLDFDNFSLNKIDFENLNKLIQKNLQLKGFPTEIRNVYK